MAVAESRKGVLNEFNAAPSRVQNYFSHLPGLLESFPLDVSLSYAFSQVELAQNMTLYCGVVYDEMSAVGHATRLKIELADTP